MRISTEAARIVVDIISTRYGEDCPIWLFGSRADDTKRGGDVDIFVQAESSDVMHKIDCKRALTELLDLNVDLVVGNGDKPIHRIAKQTGVRLK